MVHVDVAELVDALGLGSSELIRGGSSPLIDTGFQNSNLNSMIWGKKFPLKNHKKSRGHYVSYFTTRPRNGH